MKDVHLLALDKLSQSFDIDLGPRDYYYVDENKAIEFEFDLEDQDKIPRTIDLSDHYIKLIRKLKGVVNDDKITYKYIITVTDTTQFYNDITRGGFRKYGVIDPKGNFYECRYAGHHDLEFKLRSLGIIDKSDIRSVSDSFECYGWVKLTGASMVECEFLFKYEIDYYDFETKQSDKLRTHSPTDKQIETMIRYKRSLSDPEDAATINYNFNDYPVDGFEEAIKSITY